MFVHTVHTPALATVVGWQSTVVAETHGSEHSLSSVSQQCKIPAHAVTESLLLKGGVKV